MKARHVLAFSALFALVGAPAAQGARPMTLEDLLKTVRVTDPQLSRDGRNVAFVRTTTDLDSGKRNADVWLMPSDGSTSARALTRHEKSDSAPRFSPDGTRLAFVSARNGTPQVYTLELNGGEPQRLTSLSAGVSDPLVWSPDGKHVA
ncbi:MAG: S9 family peptidase, partial [Thermoanaerobaculia bacterium]